MRPPPGTAQSERADLPLSRVVAPFVVVLGPCQECWRRFRRLRDANTFGEHVEMLSTYEFIELPTAHGAFKAQQQASPSSALSVTLPCLVWVSASNGLILLNKYIMSSDGFKHPMALSSLGMVTSWLLSVVVCRLGLVRAQNRVSPAFFVTRFLEFSHHLLDPYRQSLDRSFARLGGLCGAAQVVGRLK